MNEEFQFDEAELMELRTMFFEQATEVINSLSELIIKIERDPANSETLRSIRRAVHTLKGDSTAFGFTELNTLAHHYEDALDKVREGSGVASRALIDLLLAGADALAAMIAHYRGNGPMPKTEALIAGLSGLAANTTDTVDSEPAPVEVVPAESFDIDEKTVVERRTGHDRRAGTDRRSATDAGSMTLRVESERIDTTMNLVGELIIQRSMIATLATELDASRQGNDNSRRLVEAVAVSGRILSELQESVMRMRLVAIDQVFRRFPRVVRDASVKLGKPLRMEIEGGHTEVDKSIVEVISDPLIHLVRNACDHGIEAPEARIAAGKPAEGTIKLAARRAGNQIAVEVEDDGLGIDPARIVAKAVEKKLVRAEEVGDWTDQQKLSLIFAPGFSTKEQVSDMSGRGVGMDVVKTTVDSLGGSVTLSSVSGQGSKITIKLPLTMAIVRAMLFDSCERRFALPLDSIREITRLSSRDVKSIDGHEVLRLRERVLPLIRIDEVLNLRDPAERDLDARLFVFVIDLGDGRDVGIAVERLHGEQELVLKTVDDELIRSAVVAGASILGDGRVVLILDPQSIIEGHRKASAVEPSLSV